MFQIFSKVARDNPPKDMGEGEHAEDGCGLVMVIILIP